MRRLDPIPGWPRFANGYFYTLADELDELESQQITSTEATRMEFFQQHWPELHMWLSLNIDSENWRIYYKNWDNTTSLILAIYFDDTIMFNLAFADELVFAEFDPTGFNWH